MKKEQTIKEMRKILNKIDRYNSFSGRAGLIKHAQGQIDFLVAYKTDHKLEQLLLKECKESLGKAKKLWNQKIELTTAWS